jgi:hypothetical protein
VNVVVPFAPNRKSVSASTWAPSVSFCGSVKFATIRRSVPSVAVLPPSSETRRTVDDCWTVLLAKPQPVVPIGVMQPLETSSVLFSVSTVSTAPRPLPLLARGPENVSWALAIAGMKAAAAGGQLEGDARHGTGAPRGR